MQDLISLNSVAAVQPTAPPDRKSAGCAWLLSTVIPGAGHLYLGLYLRAGLVFGFSLLGLLALVATIASGGQAGSASVALITALPILWVFAFIDAYMTAVERNRGIDPSAVDNPRIAAVLNATTRGFGYFYLGERTKGITLFVVLGMANMGLAVLTGRVAAIVGIVALAITAWITIDAYRLGRTAFEAQVAAMELPVPPPASRVPIALPVALGAVVAFALAALFLLGAVGSLLGVGQPQP